MGDKWLLCSDKIVVFYETVVSHHHLPRKETDESMVKITPEIIFKVLEYIILFLLTTTSIFLSWEAFAKYQSKDTNLKRRHQEVRKHPTLTICFNPTFDDGIYGQDFHFNIYDNKEKLFEDIEHKTNVLQEGANSEHEVDLIAIFSSYYGRCFKINPRKHIVSKSFTTTITIKFRNSLSKSKIPSAEVYFTSETNSIGIGRAYWYEGEELMVSVPVNRRKAIQITEREFNYLEEKQGCSNQESWYECYAKLVEGSSFGTCLSKCLAHSIRHNGSENMMFCKQNTEEWNCSNKFLRHLRKDVIENGTCPRSCAITNYKGKITHDFAFDHKNTIAFSYYFAPPFISIIYEEYLLFDFLGLISSVGGTLGMFIGFSFIAIISIVFSYLLIHIKR